MNFIPPKLDGNAISKKLNSKDLSNILKERQKYVKKTNKDNIIYFSKEEFLQINNTTVCI